MKQKKLTNQKNTHKNVKPKQTKKPFKNHKQNHNQPSKQNPKNLKASLTSKTYKLRRSQLAFPDLRKLL